MTVPIAHAGHWLPIVAYALPVVLLVLWLVLVQLRERRRGTGP